MKEHLCLVCCALAGTIIQHFAAFAQTAKPDPIGGTAGTFAPLKIDGQSSKERLLKECEDEWRADQEAMMKRGMTKDSYVKQCSVKDDVPAIPTKTPPSAAPK